MEPEIKKKGLSDETFDVITALVLISCIVVGVVYWLSGMPS